MVRLQKRVTYCAHEHQALETYPCSSDATDAPLGDMGDGGTAPAPKRMRAVVSLPTGRSCNCGGDAAICSGLALSVLVETTMELVRTSLGKRDSGGSLRSSDSISWPPAFLPAPAAAVVVAGCTILYCGVA